MDEQTTDELRVNWEQWRERYMTSGRRMGTRYFASQLPLQHIWDVSLDVLNSVDPAMHAKLHKFARRITHPQLSFMWSFSNPYNINCTLRYGDDQMNFTIERSYFRLIAFKHFKEIVARHVFGFWARIGQRRNPSVPAAHFADQMLVDGHHWRDKAPRKPPDEIYGRSPVPEIGQFMGFNFIRSEDDGRATLTVDHLRRAREMLEERVPVNTMRFIDEAVNHQLDNISLEPGAVNVIDPERSTDFWDDHRIAYQEHLAARSNSDSPS